MADDKAAILAALRGGQDAMPFGVGGPAESQAWAPDVIGGVGSALVGIPKHLIDASKNAVPGLRKEDFSDNPNAPQPNQPLYNAAADTAMALAGTGAPMAEAGAAGIFGGKLAKTADVGKLQEAERMVAAGHGPDEIIGKTGWFQHPSDGKWRFEIPDERSKMVNHGLDYTRDGDFIGGPAQAMFSHPELYQAYPELKDVKFFSSSDKIRNGQWDPARQELSVVAPDADYARKIALHELQHVVQSKEGFSSGANPSYMALLQEKHPHLLPASELKTDPYDLYHKLSGEVEARNVDLRRNMTPKERQVEKPWESEVAQGYPWQDQMALDPVTQTVQALRNK